MNGWERALQLVQDHPAEVSLAAATVLGAVGLWLMLPRGNRRGRRLGALVALVALGLLIWCLPRFAGDVGWFPEVLFWAIAGTTVVSAAGAVTFRSPAYCAIWFALTLLGTAALLFFQGAQFLAVATVAVYAGAILVTFLFVLMLAQPAGDAPADRVSWEPLLAAAAGMVLVGVLSFTVLGAFANEKVAASATLPATEENIVLSSQHMAGFGGELFSRHLVAVEVAGTLLLVAVVGAVTISSWRESRAADVKRPEGTVPIFTAQWTQPPRAGQPP